MPVRAKLEAESITELLLLLQKIKSRRFGSRLRTLNQPGEETGLKIYRLLRARDIEGIGFFLGDKRPGDFSLELVKIEAMYKPPIMNDNT